MDIEVIWKLFLKMLCEYDSVAQATYKKSAGIPFLYIHANEHPSKNELEKAIRQSAAGAMKGKQLHSETEFIRTEDHLFVFRHRFYVPQRKMFCCGNVCPDCIRLKNQE
ncbi:hypothetical protein AABM38_08145 [Heyndrickxia sp. MSNUG]|uniref:hypothetical protein n=1 Tax=Heyndrickxia sp. MSNUG TaxID=3136677 RepID=UPI003C2C0FB6